MTKSFAWSHSRLSSFETCPLRYEQVDLLKRYSDDNPAGARGQAIHKALEDYCRDGVPFPAEYAEFRDVGDRVRALGGEKKFEQKLAVTERFEPCEFFDKAVWFRCVVDVLVLSGRRAAALDYKTGKVKLDHDQLALNAGAIFAHYPEVDVVDTRYWWICYGGGMTKKRFFRHSVGEVWSAFLPRVNAFRNAVSQNKFLPKPSGLCKRHCPVDTCPHHGVGSR